MSDEEAAAGRLAIRICREIFMLTGDTVYTWHSVRPVALRLDAKPEATQAAIRYAVRKGWLDSFGRPTSIVVMLERGRALFADADVAVPKPAAA
jgi:hypothetical protein